MRKLLRILATLLLGLAVIFAALVAWLWPRYAYLPPAITEADVVRLGDGPIVDETSGPVLQAEASRLGYANVNYPTLIRVPEWIENPLGEYYLYFSHHKGDRIRLAYADGLEGPWTLHEPGALTIAASGFPSRPAASVKPIDAIEDLFNDFSIFVARDYLILLYQANVIDRATRAERGLPRAAGRAQHIASPDILVDDENRQIYMYYHGLEYGSRQLSRVARSTDGLSFEALPGTIPSPYLRSFEYRGRYYLLGMPGVLFRSDSPAGPFVARDRLLFEPRMRHAGVRRDGSTLFVAWSRVGDSPERLLMSEVDLSPDNWNAWQASTGKDLLRAEFPWEGGGLPALSSVRGELPVRANELRDPYIFEDRDGQKYLLYVGGGEAAIGIATLAF